MAVEDIIWGKNRHVYGGIEPSNMLKFTVEPIDTGVRITYTLPNDTVIDGHPICTVAGAVIRRRADRYPVDEFDGDVIAIVNDSGESYFDDTTVDPNGTYYYAAFPFSTQDVYNRNAANRAAVNEPGNMVEFTISSKYNQAKDMCDVTIIANLPEGVEGAIIRKDSLDYPVDENDGELLENITSDKVITFEAPAESDLYLSAFTYNNKGNVNRNQNDFNRCYVHTNHWVWLYGYDLDTKNSDPATRVTYPADVDNANFKAAGLGAYNSSSGKFPFEYGDWPSEPGEGFMPRPCMLKYNGVVDHYLDPNDYSKKLDGTASSVADKNFSGNAMVEWPKIYTKRWEDENGIYHFRCSDAKVDDDYECWCNYDVNNNEIDHFYTSIYWGSFEDMSSNAKRIRSISGHTGGGSAYNYGSQEFMKAAQNNGDGWNIDLLSDRLLITDLLTMMGKSTNVQSVFGYGSDNYSSTEGGGNKYGMFYGTRGALGYGRNKIFGMEDYMSNSNRLTAGLLKKGGTYYVKITLGTKDGSTTNSFNTTGAGYNTSILPVLTSSGASSGYISGCKTTPFGRFPWAVNGSSTTYECDAGTWFGPTSNTLEIAYFGSGQKPGEYNYQSGSTKNGPYALVFDSQMLATENGNYVTCRASLSCKPTAKA